MATKSKKLLDPAKRVAPNTYNSALRIVNKLLTKLGRPGLKALPKGIVGDSTSCPLYSALEQLGVDEVASGNELSAHILFPGSKDVYLDIDLSQYLTYEEQQMLDRFISEFDESDDDVIFGAEDPWDNSDRKRYRVIAGIRGLTYEK